MGGPEDLGQEPGLGPHIPRHSQEPRFPREPPKSPRPSSHRPNPGGPVVDPDPISGLLGRAPAFLKALDLILKAGRSDATVLLTGETGTGKDITAKAIHALSRRASSSFIKVNCSSLNGLLEGDLFGHVPGAYTDAHTTRQGLLQIAEKGTLLLNEVETLSPPLQGVVLNLLDEKTYRPLGADKLLNANLRFIAATNQDLLALVRSGAFRADLYFRLRGLAIHLPALRERREDILPLAFHFLEKHAKGHQPVPQLSPKAQALLLSHPWPGNVRELERAIERAIVNAGGDWIEAEELALETCPCGAEPEDPPPIKPTAGLSFKQEKRDAYNLDERRILIRLLREHGGNVKRAARAAGIDPSNFRKLLKNHGLHPQDFFPLF